MLTILIYHAIVLPWVSPIDDQIYQHRFVLNIVVCFAPTSINLYTVGLYWQLWKIRCSFMINGARLYVFLFRSADDERQRPTLV